ncbi:MAG: terminase large subunit [Planctomycetota bacterium]|jgi:phage terminase large subunit-like protein
MTAIAVRSPVTAYAEAAASAEIVVGRLVRLACERHLRDLRRDDIYFDEEAADFAIEFFSHLKHSKGEWAGQQFVLEPWQMFIVGCLFGWKRADGDRRFRVSYTEVARKNGKSTLSAGIGLLTAFFDDEPGAEVYAAATKRDQAKIVWGEAKAMVNASPALKQRISVLVGNLNREADRQKFEPLGADADSTDGLNIHGAIIDELHAHKTRAMWDVIETATGARRQPLTFVITTAGYDRRTICWEQRDYAVKLLEGIFEDDTFFAYIATIDEDDDWRDPAVWPKANPNLGVSVKMDDLERKCEKAKQVPGEINAFLQLHMDVWTTQSTRWLSDEMWEACDGVVDAEELKDGACFGGLMASTTFDIAALVLYFPEGHEVLSWFWVPAERIPDRVQKDMVPYDEWEREDYITATQGNVIDFATIRAKVNELGEVYDIRELAMKRWNTPQLQTDLMDDGFDERIVLVGDGYKDMSPGTRELEKLLVEKKLRHGGNPVLRWMASNIAIRMDPEERIRPDKAASTERYDGIEALIIAISRGLEKVEEGEAGVMFV